MEERKVLVLNRKVGVSLTENEITEESHEEGE